MRELRLTTVITTDGHFRQVGFMSCPRLGLNECANRGALDMGLQDDDQSLDDQDDAALGELS